MKNVSNLSQILSEYGYDTIAIHPELASNRNRKNVYSNFLFDRFVSIDDFIEPLRYRGHVSDRASYDKVIEEYESMNKPGFIFNVTMQNHSGYDINTLGDLTPIDVSQEVKQYPQLVTYMTLMNESVNAFMDLLDYFSKVEEPVIICLFGDHQPYFGGPADAYVYGGVPADIGNKQRKYEVPYLIWSNQYMGEETNVDMSANYLGAYLLEQAGFEGTSYSKYLLQLMNDVPAINAFGYMDADKVWHSFEEETKELQLIEEYRIAQYSSLLDKKREKRFYHAR